MMTNPIKTRDRSVNQPFNRGPAGWSLTEPLGKWKWEKPPKFVKNYLLEASSIEEAIKNYVSEVKEKKFPGTEHTFK